jgi:hypothetical protein
MLASGELSITRGALGWATRTIMREEVEECACYRRMAGVASGVCI